MVEEARYTRTPIRPDRLTAPWATNGEWFITSYRTTRYLNGKPVIETEDVHGPDGWRFAMRILPEEKRSETPVLRPGGRVPLTREFIELCRQGHDESYHGHTRAEVLGFERSSWERHRRLREFLSERYGQRRGLTILELAPNATTSIPRTLLSPGSGNRYIGLDLVPNAIRWQRELLQDRNSRLPVPGYDCRVDQVVADAYQPPFRAEFADLIVDTGVIFMGDKEADLVDGLTEVARLLKPGGEFVTVLGDVELTTPRGIAHLLSLFDIVASEDGGSHRTLVLRKK